MRRHTRTRLNSDTSSRWLSLSFGKLDDIEPRGRRFEKPLPWTPTHLVYAPTSRSIVVVGHHTKDENNCKPTAGITTHGSAIPASRSGGEPGVFLHMPAPRFSRLSSLRIFNADTLEERPGGGPLHLLPGVRVTGITVFPGRGRNGNFLNVPMRKGSSRDPFAPQTVASAVGGDVVAVACCRCAATTTGEQQASGGLHGGGEEGEGRWEQPGKKTSSTIAVTPSGWGPAAAATRANETAALSYSSRAALVTTVIAAFEVIAHGADGVDDGGRITGKLLDRTGEGIDGDYAGNGRFLASGDDHVGRESDGGMFMAALAASSEMEGACFCLEALGERFVAGSTDDKIVVLGWEGSERGGLR